MLRQGLGQSPWDPLHVPVTFSAHQRTSGLLGQGARPAGPYRLLSVREHKSSSSSTSNHGSSNSRSRSRSSSNSSSTGSGGSSQQQCKAGPSPTPRNGVVHSREQHNGSGDGPQAGSAGAAVVAAAADDEAVKPKGNAAAAAARKEKWLQKAAAKAAAGRARRAQKLAAELAKEAHICAATAVAAKELTQKQQELEAAYHASMQAAAGDTNSSGGSRSSNGNLNLAKVRNPLLRQALVQAAAQYRRISSSVLDVPTSQESTCDAPGQLSSSHGGRTNMPQAPLDQAVAAASAASAECAAAASRLTLEGQQMPPVKCKDEDYCDAGLPEVRLAQQLQRTADVLASRPASCDSSSSSAFGSDSGGGSATSNSEGQGKQTAKAKGRKPLRASHEPQTRRMLSALQQWGENQQQQQQQEEADLEPLRRQQMLQQIMALRALQPMPVMHEMERRMCAYQCKRQLAAALLQVQLRQVLLERQQARQQHQQQGNLQQPGPGEQQRQQEVQVQAGQQQGVKQPRRWQGRKHRSPAILQREYRQQKQYQRWLVYKDKQARKAQQAESRRQSAEMLFSAGTDSDTDADACIAAILSSLGIGTATREVLEQDSTGDSQDGAGSDTTATLEPAVASQKEQESDTEQPPARQRQLQQSSHSAAPWSLGFLYKAASPGVLLAVLQHHPGDLSVTSCSLAYARLAELCRDSPALLQHQYTQQLLQLLQTELPRLQQKVQLWHLATMSAAALSLQQPQLARVMLPQLLQQPQRQDPVQLLCSVVACVRLQQTGLSKALLRLLLLGDGVLPPQPGSLGGVAAFAGLTDRPLLQQQQQQR